MTDLIAKFIVAASVQYLRQTNSGRGTPMLMSWRIYRNRQAAQQVLLDYTCLGPLNSGRQIRKLPDPFGGCHEPV
jgi:hypothetical protein